MVSKYVEKIRSKIRTKKFLKEIRVSQSQGVMTDWLAKKFVEMSENYGNSARFVNYPDLEDMKAHALMQLSTSWTRFDPDRFDDAHAYFTTVINCAFAYYLNREKRDRTAREDYIIHSGDGNSTPEIYVDDEQHF